MDGRRNQGGGGGGGGGRGGVEGRGGGGGGGEEEVFGAVVGPGHSVGDVEDDEGDCVGTQGKAEGEGGPLKALSSGKWVGG